MRCEFGGGDLAALASFLDALSLVLLSGKDKESEAAIIAVETTTTAIAERVRWDATPYSYGVRTGGRWMGLRGPSLASPRTGAPEEYFDSYPRPGGLGRTRETRRLGGRQWRPVPQNRPSVPQKRPNEPPAD